LGMASQPVVGDATKSCIAASSFVLQVCRGLRPGLNRQVD